MTLGWMTRTARIPVEAIQAAEAEFNKLTENYPDGVQSPIDELSENYHRCIDTPEIRYEKVAAIYEIAHDRKGQGGTFGYPLITNFGDPLNEYTHKPEEATDNLV